MVAKNACWMQEVTFNWIWQFSNVCTWLLSKIGMQSQISQKTFFILYLFVFQGNGRCGWQGREPSEPVQLYRPLHVIGQNFVTFPYHYRAPYVMTVTTVGLDLYCATKSNYCRSVPTSPDLLVYIVIIAFKVFFENQVFGLALILIMLVLYLVGFRLVEW